MIMPHFEQRPRERDEAMSSTTMLATLIVRPAVQVGPGFEDAVLGVTKHQVTLRFVEATSGAGGGTAFVAASSAASHEERLGNIVTIRDRIETLSNELGRAALMINEDPFPAPENINPAWIAGSEEPGER
ncbi:MAG TPA: hypothetical protein VIM53_01785 [Candidatus Saccharimonadales bacterium]